MTAYRPDVTWILQYEQGTIQYNKIQYEHLPAETAICEVRKPEVGIE